jgi:hypothetical protein
MFKVRFKVNVNVEASKIINPVTLQSYRAAAAGQRS